MPIENHGQFNKAMNASLERTKEGKIESSLVKSTVAKLTKVVNDATIVKPKDSTVTKQAKEKLAKNPDFQKEVYNFILRSALSQGHTGTEEYHASKFDQDNIKGLNEYEMNQWTDQLNTGIMKVLEHGSMGKFEGVEKDIKTDIEKSVLNPQFYLDKLLKGSDLGTLVSENLTNIKGAEADKLLSLKYGDKDFMKGLGFAVLKEGTQNVQDVLVFFADLLAIAASMGAPLVQYGYYRTRHQLTRNSEWKAKMEAMGENHPVLGLVNMLTTSDGRSKFSELITSFGDPSQLTTQKIAIAMTTLVGLIGGGVGLAKGAVSLTGKFVRKYPQLAKLSKVASKTEKALGDTAKVIEKVDNIADPLGNAAGRAVGTVANKITDAANAKPNQLSKAGKDTLIKDYLEGRKNTVSDQVRITDAESLLGFKVNAQQQQAIIKAHNVPMGKNTQKGRILRDAGFSEKDTRLLMESGVCGFFDELKRGFDDFMNRNYARSTNGKIALADIKSEIKTKIHNLNLDLERATNPIDISRIKKEIYLNMKKHDYLGRYGLKGEEYFERNFDQILKDAADGVKNTNQSQPKAEKPVLEGKLADIDGKVSKHLAENSPPWVKNQLRPGAEYLKGEGSGVTLKQWQQVELSLAGYKITIQKVHDGFMILGNEGFHGGFMGVGNEGSNLIVNGKVILGRGKHIPDNELTKNVSREHLKLKFYSNGIIIIEDMSKNGTILYKPTHMVSGK